MKTFYHDTPETGEFTGQSAAAESPLEPGVFLIPAHATETAPPATGDGMAAVFREGRWAVLPDLRGTDYWLPDGSKQTMHALGELPQAALREAPPPDPIETARADLLAQFFAQEAHQTLRLLRGAVLGNDADRKQLSAIEQNTAALREKLKALSV